MCCETQHGLTTSPTAHSSVPDTTADTTATSTASALAPRGGGAVDPGAAHHDELLAAALGLEAEDEVSSSKRSQAI